MSKYSKFEDMSVPIAESSLHSRCHVALIGGSGTGKSTWACRGDRTMVVLTESQAVERIRASNPQARVILVSDANEIKEVTEWLNTVVFAEGYEGFVPDTIVLDSVTEMCRMLSDVLDAAKGGGDWGYQHWKRYKDGCLRLVRAFRNMPVNVVGLFLDDVIRGENNSSGGRRMSTGMSSMAPAMASLFNLCFWAVVQERSQDEVIYAIRTVGGMYNGTELEQGKGDPSLPKWINPTDMPPAKVIAAVSGHNTETEE